MPLAIGLIGCGNISDIYLTNAKLFRDLAMVACADLRPEAASAKATRYGLRSMSVDGLIAADDIDLVLNLTVPAAHTEVSRAVISNPPSSTKRVMFATPVSPRPGRMSSV